MLDKSIHTFIGRATAGRGRNSAGQVRIFGIVFIVAARERQAMDVHSRSIPARTAPN